MMVRRACRASAADSHARLQTCTPTALSCVVRPLSPFSCCRSESRLASLRCGHREMPC